MLYGFTHIYCKCETMACIRLYVYVQARLIVVNLSADAMGIVFLDFG